MLKIPWDPPPLLTVNAFSQSQNYMKRAEVLKFMVGAWPLGNPWLLNLVILYNRICPILEILSIWLILRAWNVSQLLQFLLLDLWNVGSFPRLFLHMLLTLFFKFRHTTSEYFDKLWPTDRIMFPQISFPGAVVAVVICVDKVPVMFVEWWNFLMTYFSEYLPSH